MTHVDPGGRADRFVREALPHNDYLLRGAWKLTGQRADAEDLVQETMLKAYLAFGQFRQGSNLRPWLYQIMANAWVDRYRSAQRRPPEELSADITELQFAGTPIRGTHQSQSAEAQVFATLPSDASIALHELPDDLRMTVYFADVEGFRNTEIAKILEIPVGTVASRLHRGRRQLRELLVGHRLGRA